MNPGPTWRVEPASAVLDAHPAAESWLSDAERARRTELRRAADREAFSAAHALARLCAADLLGVSPATILMEQRCHQCGGAHGRSHLPSHPHVGISVSHSGTWAAAAAALAPCGIDIEQRPTSTAGRFAGLDRALAPRERSWLTRQPDVEQAFLALWVRKEALIKSGIGSIDDLTAIDLVDEAGDQMRDCHGGRRLHPIDVSPSVIAALAVAAGR